MSSGTKTEPALAEDPGLELTLLCDALDMPTRGGFLFAVCEEGPLRERLVQQVRDHLQAEGDQAPIEVELSPDQPDLAGTLTFSPLRPPLPLPALGEGERGWGGVGEGRSPPVVFVHTHGLAEPRDEAALRALRAVNFQRERLSRLETPFVFWLSQNTLGQVVQHAADLFAARSGIFYFEAPLRGPTAPPPMRAEAVTDLLDRFHRTLLPPEELRKRAALYERRLEQQRAAETPNWPRIAFLCRDLANIHRELDDYARAGAYQDEAIEAYQKAITAQETEDKGPEWANLQIWLGLAHHELIRGDRTENLEQAIVHYQRALEVYTRQDFPADWAMTQNNLGGAYFNRIRGDRAENPEQAIVHYQRALEVYTRQDFPERWAFIQGNLGNTYANRIRGDCAENIEQAIQHYEQTLEVYTRQDFSKQWATAQNNLGNAYFNRIRGERAENLEQAIAHHQRAQEVYTRRDFPEQWATAQNNLGNAYIDRIRGERAENLDQAIDRYQRAQEVYTRQDFPEQWATTQNNLGAAYHQRIRGERAENLERAIACYNDALGVWTAEAFPHDHEIATRNLERALAEPKPLSLQERVRATLRRIRHALKLRKSQP